MSNAPAFDAARRSRELGRRLERGAKRSWQFFKHAWALIVASSFRARDNFVELDQRATARVDALPQHRVRQAAIAVAGTAAVGILALAIAPALTKSDDRSNVAAPATDAAPALPVAGGVEIAQAYTSGISDGRNGRMFALVNGEPLFPLPNAALSLRAEQPVEMQSVLVHAVVPGVGLWMGDSVERRVFVAVSPEADARSTVRLATVIPGQMLNLSGRFKALTPANPVPGITPELGSAQLVAQGALVQADSLRQPTT